MSLLGPSVHTYGVIRPNYERKVRFPFMLLNKSWAALPSISQHQQGAGDLQIKRSCYLCPPHPHPHPLPCPHPHHHLDCCPPQHRCRRGAGRVRTPQDVGASTFCYSFFQNRGCGPVHIPPVDFFFFCTGIRSCSLSNVAICK